MASSTSPTTSSSWLLKWSACSAGILFIGYKIKTVFFDDEYTAKESCRTIQKSKVYLNEWTIEKFATAKSGDLKSAVFSGTTNDGNFVAWSFLLNPNTDNGKSIKIKVQSVSGDIHGEADIAVETSFSTWYSSMGRYDTLWDRPAVIRCHLSRDGSLKLVFRVTFAKNVLKGPSEGLPKPPPSSLEQNYADLLSSNQFCDITVKVGQRTFHAHKAVFAARSTVFAAMFQHDMQESQRNEITITDVEPSVFEEVMRFIYTDKADGLPRGAFELLAAADKYDLARLKALCEIELLAGITMKSATKTLEFADLYRAPELKSRTMQMIVRNLGKIPDWEQFCKSRPELVAEILAAIAKGSARKMPDIPIPL